MSKMKNERFMSFDMLKLFIIFLVLIGHCIQHLISNDFRNDNMWVFIYSFHMPLFMVISGYFSKSSMSMHFHRFVKKKFKQLILPMISWLVVIASLIWIKDLVLQSKNIELTLLVTLFMTSFWFLKCLFICYILSYFIFNCKNILMGGNIGYQFVH